MSSRSDSSPVPVTPSLLRDWRLPAPGADKYSRGSVLVVGGGGIGSRLVERQLNDVLQPAAISVRMVAYASSPPGRDPAHWYQNAEDRRAVLDSWLQQLVPYLSGYDAGT